MPGTIFEKNVFTKSRLKVILHFYIRYLYIVLEDTILSLRFA